MKSKADRRDSLENKRGMLSHFHSSFFSFFIPAAVHRSDALFFGKRQFVLISNSAQSGWRPLSNFTNVLGFYFLSCFSESSCAGSLPCGVLEAKTSKDSRGQRVRGVGWDGGFGGHSLKTVTGLKRLTHVAIFSMMVAKTPGLCL